MSVYQRDSRWMVYWHDTEIYFLSITKRKNIHIESQFTGPAKTDTANCFGEESLIQDMPNHKTFKKLLRH